MNDELLELREVVEWWIKKAEFNFTDDSKGKGGYTIKNQ